jgi:hypothetical protein
MIKNCTGCPIILYGSEICTLKKRIKKIDISRGEIFRRKFGCILFDHKRNEEILEGLKAELADGELRRYKSNCLRRVTRVLPKIMLNCRPMDEDELEDLGRDY